MPYRLAKRASVIVVGVISDTHGLMREEALAALQGSQIILHAGDIGNAAILEALRKIAPVRAVRGNNDVGPWAAVLPLELDLLLESVRIILLHDIADFSMSANPPDVVVVGHSHKPRIETRRGVIEINPGSAGPRRFSLPVSVARLVIEGNKVSAEVIELTIAAPTAAAGRSRGRHNA